MGKSLLIVLTDPVEGREDEYNEWYSGRHLEDVLRVEGFTAAQRFKFSPTDFSPDAPFQYLAIYEVEDADHRRVEEAMLAASRNKEEMPISRAMDKKRATWWFTAIGDRLEATTAAPAGSAVAG